MDDETASKAQFLRQRVGEPADLDKAFCIFATPNPSFLTGQILHRDDGQGL